MLLLLLIPVIIFVTTLVRIRLDEREKLRETYLHVEETSLLASIIHELQKEFALANGYISTKGLVFGTRLRAQFQSTDKAYSNWLGHLEKLNINVMDIPVILTPHSGDTDPSLVEVQRT